MSLISDDYRALNARLHGDDANYGTSGGAYVDLVASVAKYLKTTSILDYGCGKRRLEAGLPGFSIANYDPCIPGLDRRPQAADVVVCTDVLEHIEPEHLDGVLTDLKALTRRVAFFAVATGPARKVLADGRNAHLIQQDLDWWLPKLESLFRTLRYWETDRGFIFIGQSYDDRSSAVLNLNHIGPPPTLTQIKTKSCFTDEQRCENIRSAMLRGLPIVPIVPAHEQTMVLACYGPSLIDTVDQIRAEVDAGGDLYTVSGAHDFLIGQGIVPKGHIEADPRPHKAKLIVAAHKNVVYFLSSACAREMFDRAYGSETWVFHVTSSPRESHLIQAMDNPGSFTLDGGTNVGMTALALGTVLGYRKFSIYGMDCSFKGEPELLAWPKDKDLPAEIQAKAQCHAGFHPNEDQPLYRVWVGDRPFLSSPQLFQAAQDYAITVTGSLDCEFVLHGDGFLPALMAQLKVLKAERKAA